MEKIEKKLRKNLVISRKHIDMNRNIISAILLIGYLIFTAIYFS
ncbi:hypothetical protein [Flavobacterium sp. SM2513]